MPGTSKHSRRSHAKAIALAGLATMLLALPGCYPRQSIPSDPSEGARPAATPPKAKLVIKDDVDTPKAAKPEATKAEATTTEAPKVAPVQAEPVQAEPVQAEPVQAEPVQAEPAKADEPKPEAAPAPKAQDNATASAATSEAPAGSYYVQIGSFATAKNAEGAVSWLKEKGYTQARIVLMPQGATTYHRVQTGPFPSYAAARKVLEELKLSWPQVFIPGD
jgi:cell division protein FtsN